MSMLRRRLLTALRHLFAILSAAAPRRQPRLPCRRHAPTTRYHVVTSRHVCLRLLLLLLDAVGAGSSTRHARKAVS